MSQYIMYLILYIYIYWLTCDRFLGFSLWLISIDFRYFVYYSFFVNIARGWAKWSWIESIACAPAEACAVHSRRSRAVAIELNRISLYVLADACTARNAIRIELTAKQQMVTNLARNMSKCRTIIKNDLVSPSDQRTNKGQMDQWTQGRVWI